MTSDGTQMPWTKFGNKKDDDFFGAVGRLALSWGHLDLGLAGMTHLLYYLFKGREITKEKPKALGRRITFIRDIVRRLPLEDEHRARYFDFANQVEVAAEKRHDIIHGAVVEHLDGDGKATLVRIVPKTGEIRHHTATTKSVLVAAVEANKLAGFAFTFIEELQSVLQELRLQPDAQRES
jgi:hypothetical protein